VGAGELDRAKRGDSLTLMLGDALGDARRLTVRP